MATTIYFEEIVHDQGKRTSMEIELGRSSFYPEHSIYLKIDGKFLIMDRATAERFVEAVANVGHGLDL
jgi:hypothetical protein